MQLKKGASVESSAGEKIGSLDRVVLDPETKEVTHIIVEKGWLFTENKVIQIQDVSQVEEDGKIVLGKPAEEFNNAPTYDTSTFINVSQGDYPDEPRERSVDGVYWYPALNTTWWGGGPLARYPKPKYVKAEKVIPDEQVALKEGSRVISKDGKNIGNVEQVIVDPEGNIATHIVIGAGLVLREEKMIPTLWIKDVKEDQVRLTIWSDMFEQLPDYEPAK
jgi:uncharacterized protein YrrD